MGDGEMNVLRDFHIFYMNFTFLGRISFSIRLIEYGYFTHRKKRPRISRTLLHFLN